MDRAPKLRFLKFLASNQNGSKGIFHCAFWIFSASSPWKSVNIYRVARVGQNFDDCSDFQPKKIHLGKEMQHYVCAYVTYRIPIV